MIETCFVVLREELKFQSDCMRSYRVLKFLRAEAFGCGDDRSEGEHEGPIFVEACGAESQTYICASKCLHHAGEVLRGTYQLSCARCLSHYVRSEQQLVILVEEKVTIALAGTCVSAPLGHVGGALCVSAVLQLLAF